MELRHQLTNLSFRLVRTWSVIISENAKPNKDKINTESIPSTDWYSIELMSYLIEHKPIQNRSFLSFKIPIQLVFEAKFKNSLKKSSFSSYRCEDVFTNPENIFLICFNFASNSRMKIKIQIHDKSKQWNISNKEEHNGKNMQRIILTCPGWGGRRIK